MAIEEIVDPRTKKKLLVAEGKVTGIYFNELKEPRDLSKDPSKSWVVTHSINIVVDGVKVSLGMTDKTELRCKDADGEFHDVVKGVEVSISVTEGTPYKGVKQYQAFSKDVIVLDASGAEAEKPAQTASATKQTYAKKDMTGIHVGHSINVAINSLGGEAVDNPEGVIELAKKAHDLTQAMKAEYGEKNPDMSEYDLGAMVGQSVLSASNITDFDSIEAVARDTLDKIVPEVSAYIKGTSSKPEAKKTAPKKTVAKKATTKKEPPQEAPQEPDDFVGGGLPPNLADMDDDIPF